MTSDLGAEIQVPVSRLMCQDVRMASLLSEPRPIHRGELPLFLSLLDTVLDRWYNAVGAMNPAIYENYQENAKTVSSMQSCFSQIAEDDSHEVFAVRENLGQLIKDFDRLMDNLAEVFTAPQQLREFYYNISSRLKLTVESIEVGNDGW